MSDVLTYFIENDPIYANTSQDFVAKDLYDKFGKPEGWSENGFYEDILGYKAPGFGGEFAKGFTRSMKEIGTLATSGMAALAASGADKALAEMGIETGLEKTSEQYAKKAYDRLEELGRQYPMSVETRHEVKDLESALQYAGGLAGQGLGSTADMAATALLAGLASSTGVGLAAGASAVASGGVRTAGKEALKQAARKAGKELTDEMLEKQMSGAMGRAFSTGAKIGAVGGSVAAESGSSYLDLLREGQDAPGVAIAAGALKGSLEILPEFAAVARLFKSAPAAEAFKAATTKEIMKRFGLNVAGEVGKISGGEALTEAAQQAVDIAASDFVNGRATDLFSPQNVDKLIEAGIAGAIGGAPIGVMSGTVQSLKPGQATTESPAEEEVKFIKDAVVDEVTPVTEAIDPLSPRYNESVAAGSSSVPPAETSNKAGVESAITAFNEQAADAPKVDEIINKLVENVRGPDEIVSEFNKEPRSSVVDKAPTALNPLSLPKKPRQPKAKKVDPTKPMVEQPTQSVATPTSPKPVETVDGVNYDAVKGLGAVPNLQEVDYRGETVYMSPKEYLALAEKADLDPKTVSYLQNEIDVGNPLGQPYLTVDQDDSGKVSVVGHDGRHRAEAVRKLNPKAKIPVQIHVRSPGSGRKEAVLSAAKQSGIIPEGGKKAKPYPGTKVNTQGTSEQIVSTQTSSPAKASAALTEIRNTLKDILGDNNVAVDFFDSINGITSDGKNVSLRGAQWANVIQVAVNPDANPNARETALHEAFHFLYNNVLSQPDRNRIENSRDALAKYINEQTNVPLYDLSMFDSEELGATAFGLWADSNKPAPSVHTAGRVLQKLKNILKSISKAFRRNGLKDIESLFQDVVQGNLAMPQVDEILDNERLIRTQKATAQAHERAQRFIVSNQAELTPARVRGMFGKALGPGLMEWTRMNEFIARKFNTNMGLAAKDPVWGVIFNLLHAKDRHLAVMDTMYMNQLQDLFKNKPRMVNAAGVMDILSSSDQSVNVDTNGRVYYRQGNEVVTINPEVSKDVLTLHNAFRDVLAGWGESIQAKIKHVDGFNSLDEAIQYQKDILESFADSNRVMSLGEITAAQHRLAKLEGMKDMLTAIEKQLASNKAYFPHLANGTHGVTIRRKDKPNEPLPFGFAMVGQNLNGKASQKEIDAVIKRWADEYGYSGDQYTISPAFELTRGELRKALGDQGINMDVLASLMASANPKLADEVQSLINGVREDNALLRFNSSFIEQKNTLLYSKDYATVVPSYFSSIGRSLNNFEYSDVMKVINDLVDSGTMQTPEGKLTLSNPQKQFYREMLDYITKPSTDMAGLRAFNFMFALGGNISTGVLQLATLPTAVAGIMNTYTGNPITNNALLMKNMAKASAIMTDAKLNIDKLGDDAFLEKHFKDESVRDAVRQAYTRGIFRPARLEDMTGQSSFTSGRPGSGGYVDWVREKGKRVLGLPIQTGEEISRLSSFISLYETLSDPKAFEAFENNFVQGNSRYESFKDINNHLSPAAYASLFALDETHGIFNKLGRGKNQQGIYGAVLFPFMGHPLMMMGLMNRMMQGGMVNKRAAAYIIMSTMLLAGLYGIPGWELWKETAEWVTKQTTGKEVDLQHEFKAALVEFMGFNPAVAEGLSEGALKPLLGIDIARRVGMPVFFQDMIIPFLQGRGGADQLSGVAGSQIRNIATSWDKMASGEMDLADALFETLTPTAFRNMYKAAAVWPEKGIRTASGNQIMTPEEIDPSMVLKKALGFQPSQVSREYEKRAVERLQGTGWRFGYDRRINNLARTIHERNELEDEGKDVTKINQDIADQRRELYAFARDAGKTIDREFARSVTESISRRLRNARNPDRPQRRYENVDYNILNVLYERE